MKLDVASFFPSIHKATLYDILARGIHPPDGLWLMRALVFHDPTQDYRCRCRGSPGLGPPDYPVAPHKRLFGKGNECGLPIGNLSSQFRGNVYLNELDRFIKDVGRNAKRFRHDAAHAGGSPFGHPPYIGDMVLLAQEQETLLVWCAANGDFCGCACSSRCGRRQRVRPVRFSFPFTRWR